MSFASEWQAVKDAWNDSGSSASPGARFGLLFDPTRYVADAFGKGDEYRNAITKSGDWANERLSGMLGTRGGNGWAANKPASTIGLLAAGYFGGGAALGGGSGGGMFGGGSSGSGLGIFGNGGQGGLAGVGGGNAGALASQGGISGGAGIGSATSGGGFLGSLQQNPQQYLQMLQGQQQPQQQEQRPLQPVIIKGRIFWV